ncbi:MAG: hypothetical protein SO162_07470 [Candidatus Onthomorpha sp.]|nr:hypothetical protein [Candidatus Onthomorpha sp.]
MCKNERIENQVLTKAIFLLENALKKSPFFRKITWRFGEINRRFILPKGRFTKIERRFAVSRMTFYRKGMSICGVFVRFASMESGFRGLFCRFTMTFCRFLSC